MTKEFNIKAFPAKRLKAFDGMAVTAAVWQEAHDYHYLRQQFVNAHRMGPGILTGLEVLASDPPNTIIYIMPGLAVDAHGNLIIVPESVAYNLRDTPGTLYLMLSYDEELPSDVSGDDALLAPRYIQSRYGIDAKPTTQGAAGVELARIHRRDRGAPVHDAKALAHPTPNTIDLRFRRILAATPLPAITVGLVHLGGAESAAHRRGLERMTVAARTEGRMNVWYDDGAPLDVNLEDYTMLYLVGVGPFKLSVEEMNALYDYLQKGGTLLIESCRESVAASAAPPTDALFRDLLDSLGVTLKPLLDEHPLLNQPYFFAGQPGGFEREGQGEVLVGEGVIFSTCDYGCLWQGALRDGIAARGVIRSAHEWGCNLLTYAQVRRRRAGLR